MGSKKDCCSNDKLPWGHDSCDYKVELRIVEYLEVFIRTLNDFSKYMSLCRNLIDHQLSKQQAQARSQFNLPRLSSPPRNLETRDNFLNHQSTPSLRNRVSIQIKVLLKLKQNFL